MRNFVCCEDGKLEDGKSVCCSCRCREGLPLLTDERRACCSWTIYDGLGFILIILLLTVAIWIAAVIYRFKYASPHFQSFSDPSV